MKPWGISIVPPPVVPPIEFHDSMYGADFEGCTILLLLLLVCRPPPLPAAALAGTRRPCPPDEVHVDADDIAEATAASNPAPAPAPAMLIIPPAPATAASKAFVAASLASSTRR